VLLLLLAIPAAAQGGVAAAKARRSAAAAAIAADKARTMRCVRADASSRCCGVAPAAGEERVLLRAG
jgi:hypothetical protein